MVGLSLGEEEGISEGTRDPVGKKEGIEDSNSSFLFFLFFLTFFTAFIFFAVFVFLAAFFVFFPCFLSALSLRCSESIAGGHCEYKSCC